MFVFLNIFNFRVLTLQPSGSLLPTLSCTFSRLGSPLGSSTIILEFIFLFLLKQKNTITIFFILSSTNIFEQRVRKMKNSRLSGKMKNFPPKRRRLNKKKFIKNGAKKLDIKNTEKNLSSMNAEKI